MIIKILLVASVLAALAWVMRARSSGRRLALTRIASIGVAACWIVAVLNPGGVSWAANQIGVGRGTDLVLYLLVVAFTFTTVGLYRRLRLLDDRLAEMIRCQALLQHQVESPAGRQSESDV